MAFIFVKFPKKYLQTEEWLKPRKYTKAEAILYLANDPSDHSIGQLARVWQWSKSTVHKFLLEVQENGYCERFANGLANDLRTANNQKTNKLQGSAERLPNGLPNDLRTVYIRDKDNNPPILSSTKVESNIIPPKGGSESNFLQEVSDEFREVILDWLAYKRERRESYKSQRSMRAFYNKLKTLSRNDPSVAREIIEQSMANNWAGIFPLKTENNEKQRTTYTPSNDPSARLEGVLRAAAEGIARARTPQEWESRAVGI